MNTWEAYRKREVEMARAALTKAELREAIRYRLPRYPGAQPRGIVTLFSLETLREAAR